MKLRPLVKPTQEIAWQTEANERISTALAQVPWTDDCFSCGWPISSWISARDDPVPLTCALALSYLNLLALVFDNDEKLGVWPHHSTRAEVLGVSRRTIIDLALMLRHFGVIKLLEGPTEKRDSNLYEICFPQVYKAAVQPPPVPPPPSSGLRRVRLGNIGTETP
jgi:hypothetical protein